MRTALMIFAAALALTAVPSPASAQRLRAQVYIVQQRIPRGLSSRQLVGWARGHQTTRLQETNEPNMDDRKWRAELVVSFNRAPDDNEFHVLFYDTQESSRFVNDMAVYVNDRNERTFVQRINLERPAFAPQRRMELVVTVRREEAARKSFQMLGEEHVNTGEVAFSDEEARGDRSAGDGDDEEERDEPPAQSQEPDPPPEPARMNDDPPPARRSEADRSGGLCAVDPGSRSGTGALALVVALLVLERRRRRP